MVIRQPSTQIDYEFREPTLGEMIRVNIVRATGNVLEFITEMGDLLLKCCNDTLQEKQLTTSDIHYLFLCLQGEKAKVVDDQLEQLSEINFQLFESDITIHCKPPTLDLIKRIVDIEDPDIAMYELICSCIDIITFDEEIVKWENETEEEKILFLETIPEDTYVLIANFFVRQPVVKIETE